MATMRGLVEPRAVLSAAPARRARADAAPSRHVLARSLSQSDADAGGVEGAAERALRVKEMQRRLLEQASARRRAVPCFFAWRSWLSACLAALLRTRSAAAWERGVSALRP